jgi:hypothetical protein
VRSGAEERDENIKRGVKQHMVVVGWWIWRWWRALREE